MCDRFSEDDITSCERLQSNARFVRVKTIHGDSREQTDYQIYNSGEIFIVQSGVAVTVFLPPAAKSFSCERGRTITIVNANMSGESLPIVPFVNSDHTVDTILGYPTLYLNLFQTVVLECISSSEWAVTYLA